MKKIHPVSKLTLRIIGFSILALFLIPGLTYWFSGHMLAQWDQRWIASVNASVAKQKDLSAEDKAEAQLFIQTNRPSVLCQSNHPMAAEAKAESCGFGTDLWQVHAARQGSLGALIGAVLLALAVAGLSATAFIQHNLQYASFVAGWRMMSMANAAMVLVQGAMLVWLSFWLQAFFTHKYSPKLVMLLGFLAAAGVFLAIKGIFQRQKHVNQQSGELLPEADAPRLWARIRDIAQRLHTEPPKQMVAGIDANFFVTEAPLLVGSQQLAGRTLYVSIPLLRKMQPSDADAVLSHELAHLSGGDTRHGAKLGPALNNYDYYCAQMRENVVTIVAWPLLALYRLVFEMALARSNREREFRADRLAAKLVSPQAVSQSLVKVTAYSMYRAKIENHLFEQQTQHTGALGIAAAVDQGLPAFVASPAFVQDIQQADIPHPFDSHPPLYERAKAVGVELTDQDYSRIALQQPEQTWVSDIRTADDIEQRLWGAFDEQFAAEHERSLAYRYEPANGAERAIVLKYFPGQTFTLKKDATVDIAYEGIKVSTTGELIAWDDVKKMLYQSGHFGDSLIVTLHEKRSVVGNKSTKVKLPGIGKQKEAFKDALNLYFHRHQVMRSQGAHQAV